MTVLVVGDLVFAIAQTNRSRQSLLLSIGTATATTYPSYNPTASWTKSRVSSGNSEGRRAVVRSRALRNI